MPATNTVAVLFPGVQNTDLLNASKAHQTEIMGAEVFSLQKDYMRYFKPSWHIFHQEDVNLLFVFADGTSQLAKDADTLNAILKKVEQVNGAVVYNN